MLKKANEWCGQRATPPCLLHSIDALCPITVSNRLPHLLPPLLALALTPHSANSLGHAHFLLSQGHTLINTSGLMSFRRSCCMCVHTGQWRMHTHTHTDTECVIPDARDYRMLIRGWVQQLRLTRYEHINFQWDRNHTPLAVCAHASM